MIIWGVLLGLFVLILLVVLHELGHAIVAKRNGVKVEEFGIGFPPAAKKWKVKRSFLGENVTFSLNWLPLGGFVRLKGEYDSAKAFERAGANVVTKVFKNLNAQDIRDSVDVFAKAIDQAQIIMFPGGFSAGDEPEGSAKFFATAFRNAKIKESVEKLLNERDGLCLGICNGFQALIKLGLVPYGEICEQKADSPTLTYNTIGRHISKMVYTKVMSNKSPWLAQAEVGKIYTNPASHGEGRFVANEEWLQKLFANGQVATCYVNEAGNPTMDEEWNVNGSYMAIEGITSPDGRVLGKMAHSERRGDGVAINIYGEQDLKIFESGVAFFRD